MLSFVGHPLAGEVKPRFSRLQFCLRDNNWIHNDQSFRFAGQPAECSEFFPPMLAAVKEINHRRPDVQCVLCVAPSRTIEETRQIIARQNGADFGWTRIAQDHLMAKPRSTRCLRRFSSRQRNGYAGSSPRGNANGNRL